MDTCPTCGQEGYDASLRRWQIELPMSKPISLNHNMHHQVRAKRVKEVRDAASELVALAGIPPLDRVLTSIYYSPRDLRRRDPINLVPMLKACEDGLVDAGVVPDDTPVYVRSVMPEILPKNDAKRGLLWFVVQEG